MSDYLRSEILDRLSRDAAEVPGPYVDPRTGERASLADAVVGGTSATRLLERLQRTEPPRGAPRPAARRVVPLPPSPAPAAARPSSAPRAPDRIPELHARAAAWCEANGDPARAIDHAYLAGDPDLFGRLVLEAMQQVWASGRIDTVRDWMEQLGRRAPAPHTPAMIAHGALIFALLGRAGDAERWAAVAEGLAGHRHAAGRRHGRRALWPTCGPTSAVAARRPCAGTRRRRSPGWARPAPTEPRCTSRRGCRTCSRETSSGRRRRSRMPTTWPSSIESSPLAGLVLAEQVQVAVERDDWTAAESLIKRSLEIVSRGPVRRLLDERPGVRLGRTRCGPPRRHVRGPRATRGVRHACARFSPMPCRSCSVQALVELARAYLALVDPSGARAVLEQVRGILQQRPDLGTLADGRPSAGRAGQPDHRSHRGRRLVADDGRAAAGASAAHAPDLSGDR